MIGSSTLDGVLSKIIGEFANCFIGLFRKLRITPNQMTVFSFFLFRIPAFFFFAIGNYFWNLLGVLFCLISAVFDELDGRLARATGQTSKLGAWLDPAVDVVFQFLILFGLTLGIVRSTGSFFWVGVSLFALFTLAFNNFISYQFNYTFGFQSYCGLPAFAEKFERKPKKKRLDFLLFNIVSPVNFFFISIFTLRYFIVLGVILNLVSWSILLFSLLNFSRGVIMFLIYAATFQENRSKFATIEILKKLRRE